MIIKIQAQTLDTVNQRLTAFKLSAMSKGIRIQSISMKQSEEHYEASVEVLVAKAFVGDWQEDQLRLLQACIRRLRPRSDYAVRLSVQQDAERLVDRARATAVGWLERVAQRALARRRLTTICSSAAILAGAIARLDVSRRLASAASAAQTLQRFVRMSLVEQFQIEAVPPSLEIAAAETDGSIPHPTLPSTPEPVVPFEEDEETEEELEPRVVVPATVPVAVGPVQHVPPVGPMTSPGDDPPPPPPPQPVVEEEQDNESRVSDDNGDEDDGKTEPSAPPSPRLPTPELRQDLQTELDDQNDKEVRRLTRHTRTTRPEPTLPEDDPSGYADELDAEGDNLRARRLLVELKMAEALMRQAQGRGSRLIGARINPGDERAMLREDARRMVKHKSHLPVELEQATFALSEPLPPVSARPTQPSPRYNRGVASIPLSRVRHTIARL